jgi:hypothetical protein
MKVIQKRRRNTIQEVEEILSKDTAREVVSKNGITWKSELIDVDVRLRLDNLQISTD